MTGRSQPQVNGVPMAALSPSRARAAEPRLGGKTPNRKRHALRSTGTASRWRRQSPTWPSTPHSRTATRPASHRGRSSANMVQARAAGEGSTVLDSSEPQVARSRDVLSVGSVRVWLSLAVAPLPIGSTARKGAVGTSTANRGAIGASAASARAQASVTCHAKWRAAAERRRSASASTGPRESKTVALRINIRLPGPASTDKNARIMNDLACVAPRRSTSRDASILLPRADDRRPRASRRPQIPWSC